MSGCRPMSDDLTCFHLQFKQLYWICWFMCNFFFLRKCVKILNLPLFWNRGISKNTFTATCALITKFRTIFVDEFKEKKSREKPLHMSMKIYMMKISHSNICDMNLKWMKYYLPLLKIKNKRVLFYQFLVLELNLHHCLSQWP